MKKRIVIEIDENEYLGIKEYPNNITSYPVTIHLYDAVRNGTPLPKGHGRLIDADELKEHKYHDNHRYENAVAVAYIDWAPTIIEADKAESEEV
jgi:hypothetical protein